MAGSKQKRKRRGNRNPRRDTYAGLIMLAVGIVGFYLALTKQIPFMGQGGRLVSAQFTEPNQLAPGVTPVRVNGVDVGTVASISDQHGGRSGKVMLRLTNSSVELHSDATAQIKFRTLLGANFAVDLNPGSPSAPPLGPAGISLSHTTLQTEFDDQLQTFSGNTPAATRADLRQLAAAMNGTQLGTLIDAAAPTLTPVPPAFRALRGQVPGDLTSLVASAARATSTLAGERASLQNLISGAQATLRATADESPALGQTLVDAPAALDATVSVARSVEQTLPPLDRLIAALHPGARALAPAANAAEPAVRTLRTVLDRAQPLLGSLRPAITQLAAASGPGQTVVNELKPTMTRLNQQLIPYLNSHDSALDRPIYQLIGPTFAALGSAASEYDNHAHVIHFPIQPELSSATIVPCTAFLGAPTLTEKLQCENLNAVLRTLLGGSGK